MSPVLFLVPNIFDLSFFFVKSRQLLTRSVREDSHSSSVSCRQCSFMRLDSISSLDGSIKGKEVGFTCNVFQRLLPNENNALFFLRFLGIVSCRGLCTGRRKFHQAIRINLARNNITLFFSFFILFFAFEFCSIPGFSHNSLIYLSFFRILKHFVRLL